MQKKSESKKVKMNNKTTTDVINSLKTAIKKQFLFLMST